MVGVNKKSTFWLWIVVKDGPASTPICHLLVWAFVDIAQKIANRPIVYFFKVFILGWLLDNNFK
jgi:uncharacterized membrane protein YGL010W